jgi:hypothetical protein
MDAQRTIASPVAQRSARWLTVLVIAMLVYSLIALVYAWLIVPRIDPGVGRSRGDPALTMAYEQAFVITALGTYMSLLAWAIHRTKAQFMLLLLLIMYGLALVLLSPPSRL